MAAPPKKPLTMAEAKALVINPPQMIVGLVLKDILGESISTRKEFDRKLPESKTSAPDTLLMLCTKHIFKTADLTEYLEPIKVLVEKTNLADYSEYCIPFPPEVHQVIATHAENSSLKIKVLILQDKFLILTGYKKFLTVPFTDDMEKPATTFAEYTKILFAHKKYNIEFAFEGGHGRGERILHLTADHILLFSKLTPDCFAERSREIKSRERLCRFSIFMKRISHRRSYYYFNAILELFKPFRPIMFTYGEIPKFKKEHTYQIMLELTRANPNLQFVPSPDTVFKRDLFEWICERRRKYTF